MKKYTLAFVLLAVLPVVSADAYQRTTRSGSYYTPQQSAKTTTYKTSKTTRTNGYTNTITNNFYYQQQQPARRRVSSVSDRNTGYYTGASDYQANNDNYRVVKKKTTKKTSTTQTRKFFLAHPFFQPLEGKFGSVTDISYAQNKFNFDMLNGSVLDIDRNSPNYNAIIGTDNQLAISGKQKTTQFVVKEDFSYGITDRLAVIGMAQYDKTKVTFKDWSTGDPSSSTSSSGINIFGIGLQGRIVDNEKWIAMLAGYFQHQKDTANTLLAEAKAGYKVNRVTLYGLGRLGYSDLTEGGSYGAFVKQNDDWMMLSYKTNVKEVVYLEGGIGAFAVLNKYFTLNGEMVYGHYDWHEQLNIKAAVGWQPADVFALNLYASTSLYDNAKGKIKKYMNYETNPNTSNWAPPYQGTTLVYTMGDYKIKDYNEWKIGVQGILYF